MTDSCDEDGCPCASGGIEIPPDVLARMDQVLAEIRDDDQPRDSSLQT
jgi:hypothetical protein